jgi:hypothetical protein
MAKASKPASTASKRQYRLKRGGILPSAACLACWLLAMRGAHGQLQVLLLPSCWLCNMHARTAHVKHRQAFRIRRVDRSRFLIARSSFGRAAMKTSPHANLGKRGMRGRRLHKVGEAGILQGLEARWKRFGARTSPMRLLVLIGHRSVVSARSLRCPGAPQPYTARSFSMPSGPRTWRLR